MRINYIKNHLYHAAIRNNHHEMHSKAAKLSQVLDFVRCVGVTHPSRHNKCKQCTFLQTTVTWNCTCLYVAT